MLYQDCGIRCIGAMNPEHSRIHLVDKTLNMKVVAFDKLVQLQQTHVSPQMIDWLLAFSHLTRCLELDRAVEAWEEFHWVHGCFAGHPRQQELEKGECGP